MIVEIEMKVKFDSIAILCALEPDTFVLARLSIHID